MLVTLVIFVIAIHFTSVSTEHYSCVMMRFFENYSIIDPMSSSFLETVKCFDVQRGCFTRSW
jgi:hypothetical protein